MYHYFIISGLLLFAFYLIYIAFLAKEKTHRFNRFYLLITLFISLIVPFINLPPLAGLSTISTSAVSDNFVVNTVKQINDNSLQSVPMTNRQFSMLIFIYFSIGAIFLLRFLFNLSRLVFIIRNQQSIKSRNASFILMDKPIMPFTFLNYIFVNRQDYLSNQVDNLLLEHELAHVSQKHSIDVIIIELCQIILWLNPILILYKKAIKLNHEFMADNSVIESSKKPIAYQNLLVNVSSIQLSPYFANSFNSSLTKKRLIMISRKKSPIWVATSKKLLAIVVVVLISSAFVFGQEKSERNISFKGTWEYSQKDFIGTKIQNDNGQISFKEVKMVLSNNVDSIKMITAELTSQNTTDNKWTFKSGEVKNFDKFGKVKAFKFDKLEIIAIENSLNANK